MLRIGGTRRMSVCDERIGILVAMTVMISFTAAIPLASGQRNVEVPSGYYAIYYLVPDPATAGPGENVTVQIWVNSTVDFFGGEWRIEVTDPSCAEIVKGSFRGNCTVFNWCTDPVHGHPVFEDTGTALRSNYATSGFVLVPPGAYHIGNFTVHCKLTGCTTSLNFTPAPDMPFIYITNITGGDMEAALDNGTFRCGAPTEETFTKTLYKGWNLISLPLSPSDNRTSAVLASVWENVSAVYRFNATSKQFESVMDRTMELGEGYFVYVTQNCTWTYSGTPYTSISIELKKGLNMVGWLNCSEDITDALSSIAGNYWYVARWNAIGQKFEVYNPVAPPVFNDFNTMERGEGYFISMKSDGTLTESC